MSEELPQQQLAYYASLSLDELDTFCAHTMARSSGPGGQSVNTTDSKVLTRFIPDCTIRAVSQRERSQYLNRRANLQKIHDKLVELSTPKKKRLKTNPSRASKAKRLSDKAKRGALKRSRSKDFEGE